MKRFIIILLIPILSWSQTEPVDALHKNPPRVWALTHAMIHTEPGTFIKDGNIIIRDGKIEKVGRYIQLPNDTYEIDLEGAHVYAGFIESWVEVKKEEPPKSPRDHWSSKVRPEYRAVDDVSFKEKDLKQFRSLGFTMAHIIPEKGIFRGQSGIVTLSDPPKTVLSSIAQVMNFKYGGWGEKEYPSSLLGVIAHIRQTFIDAVWYGKAQQIIQKYPDENELIPSNISFESLEMARQLNKPFIFLTRDEHFAHRALNITKEFNLTPWLLGSGYEYRRLEFFKDQKPFFIFPLEFPTKAKVTDPSIGLQYSTEQLKHWDLAPDNLQHVNNAGLDFALTTHGLKNKTQFRTNLQRVLDRGLPKDLALAALTTQPAEAMGMEKSLGKIAPGFMANLVVVDGEYFDLKSRVVSLWIGGKEFFIAPRHKLNFEGQWSLKFHGSAYDLEFTKPDKGKKGALSFPPKIPNNRSKLNGTIAVENEKIKIQNLDIFESSISFSIIGNAFGFSGILIFNGTLSKNQITGIILDATGQKLPFQADQKAKKEPKPRTPEKPSDLAIFYPEGAYGLQFPPDKPNAVLINDATLWTCGPNGTLAEWDILFVDGKIEQVAPDITVPMGSAVVIEGAGKHVTPGLIDCHSHSAAASINEGVQNVTAEVRIRDVLDADDINIYRQLGGGLTTANVLHGSANPIGGQNAVIKLRWGKGPEELIFQEAPQGIKFALGENVKQANWKSTGRYPQTRMGVEQVIRDAFRAALDYKHKKENYDRNSKMQRTKVPPRDNLELDALVEILEGKRLVHSHSYRQDEILMLTRVAEDFGFTIATFQHVLEGYKVADRIAEHGAGASTFSDWWQYKYEVIDAIPYNGALMTRNDVLVSFNSDDDELARRLNTEAIKAVKYGGLTEDDAIKYITINPAKQLKIDKWVGSLEVGKDADFVIWDGPPLSIYSHVDETWIDGIRYFSKTENTDLEIRDKELRNDLIQKILASPERSGERLIRPNANIPQWGHQCNLLDNIRFPMER
ncbi:MAG: amidohydrolase family protein [Candidatus Neomarinimicrobiota bacterium]|nr:amidohydrolase family protein [Candidatus Neomarinimicrobiota bacterium]